MALNYRLPKVCERKSIMEFVEKSEKSLLVLMFCHRITIMIILEGFLVFQYIAWKNKTKAYVNVLLYIDHVSSSSQSLVTSQKSVKLFCINFALVVFDFLKLLAAYIHIALFHLSLLFLFIGMCERSPISKELPVHSSWSHVYQSQEF